MTEPRIHLHEKPGRGGPALGREAIGLLDAALGVATVATHVPLAERATHAGLRVRMSHYADDQVTGGEAASGRRLHDPPQGFVPQDEAPVT